MTDNRFTKIATTALLNAKALCEWGIDEGHTSADELRFTIDARKKKAKELVNSGMSKRQVAKALGVAEGTIRKDLRKKYAKSAQKVRTLKIVAPDEPDDDPQTIWERGLISRAEIAAEDARYENWSQFKVPARAIKKARLAAQAWNDLADYLEKLHAKTEN